VKYIWEKGERCAESLLRKNDLCFWASGGGKKGGRISSYYGGGPRSIPESPRVGVNGKEAGGERLGAGAGEGNFLIGRIPFQ